MNSFVTTQLVPDCLGHKDLASAITNLIEAARLPANILVYGNWGTGKTSFINNFQDHLLQERADKYHVVLFNPWVYESSPNLLLLLLKAIHESMPPDLKTDLEVKKLALACFRAALDVGVRCASKVLSAGAVSMKLKDLEEVLSQEEAAFEQLKDEVNVCRTTFRKLLDKMVNQQGKHAMLVLLDDLDRCLPDNVIALIEGVKLYLSEQEGMPVVFLWAMDRDIITESIGVKYNLSSFTGRDYLEKIFDFQVPVPRLTVQATRSLIQGLFDRSSYQYGLKALLGEDPVGFLSKELDVLPLRNPRTLNRVWNMLMVLAADYEGFKNAAPQYVQKHDSPMFPTRLILGLIIAYSFREWRFGVLHNKDTWDDFLQRCRDELPDSQEYHKKNRSLCVVLSTGMRRDYITVDNGLKLNLLKSDLEELYEVSVLLQGYAC
ncbi:MAG: P-loop NTPase fold protein [Syntrophobacteraceae bacterium]